MTTREYNKSVDENADRLFRFALKNAKDEEFARDLVQDAFEKLWIKKDSVAFEKSKSYLFSTLYNAFIDSTRKEKRKREYADVYALANPTSSFDQYSDLNEILHQAIEQLSEGQKAVILLRDYEGYSYEEIGEITGMNESQVKVYIYRARKHLQKYLVKMDLIV